jgi:hypothetical protein
MSAVAARTDAANQARRKRTEQKLRHVADAIGQLQRRRLPVTYPAIASRAGVSRTFLYDNPAAQALVTAAVTRVNSHRRTAGQEVSPIFERHNFTVPTSRPPFHT